MAELATHHVPRCRDYRRAYRERHGTVGTKVCCCSSVVADEPPETEAALARNSKESVMGDMPCVWCLYWIQFQPREDGRVSVYAYSSPTSEAIPVKSWAHAEELRYGSSLYLRDEQGDYCGLTAQTLVSGDAVCIPHAGALLRARAAA